jgi:hypothetical protein
VNGLVGIERVLADERLRDQGQEKERAEEDGEAVLEQEPPHSTVSPTTVHRTMPPTITIQ